MINLVYILVLIRLRKFLPAKDPVAIGLFLIGYFAFFYLVFLDFENLSFLLYLGLIEVVGYHLKRNDLSLLQQSPKFRALLMLEYLIYLLPYLVLSLLYQSGLLFMVFSVAVVAEPFLPRISWRVFKLPFSLENPMWHVFFRKNSFAFLMLPISLMLVFIGRKYQNENILLGTIAVTSLVPMLISFRKEELLHVRLSQLRGAAYLNNQIKTDVLNYMLFAFPLALVLLLLMEWQLLLWFFISILFVVDTTCLKYMFFKSSLIQQLVLVFFIGGVFYGSILLMPLFYYSALKKINELQC